VVRDHRSIIIHALNVGDDPDLVRKDVQETLEANILKWTRGPNWRRGEPA
jgi:multisubunit Na+/H+ antiporter MnhE subunit